MKRAALFFGGGCGIIPAKHKFGKDKSLKMKRIAEDIKSGQFSHIYLLYGEEAYLRRQYCDKLKAALSNEGDTMNCTIYSGKDININEVIDMAGTMPFFAERRVIVINNSGWFKNTNEQALGLIKNLPDTTYIIFVEEEVDKRGKLYKAVASNGYAAACEVQDETTLKKWIMGILKKENKQITSDALNLLLEKTGTNMENIRRELEKLICYKYFDEGITASDVETLCSSQIQNKIFDMVEAVARKDQKEALDLYYDLIALKEAPIKILSLITRQFNMLLQVKEMKNKGYSEANIASQTGLNAYYLKKKYIPQASSFELAQLKGALKRCVEADESVKTGKMSDIMSVELIIVGLSAKI